MTTTPRPGNTLANRIRWLQEQSKSENLAVLEDILLIFKDSTDEKLYTAAARAGAFLIVKHLINYFDVYEKKIRIGLVKIFQSLEINPKDYLDDYIFAKNPNTRFNLARILLLLKDGQLIHAHFMNLLNDKNEKVRATAVSFLKFIPKRKCESILESKLADPDERVIANCIEVIEKYADPEYEQTLIEFSHHGNNRIRANAIKAKWTLGYGDPLSELQKMLQVHHDPWMRSSACWVLGECADEHNTQAIRLLSDGLYDDDPNVRRNAITACDKLGIEANEAIDNPEK